jgi:hypothetical protein
MQPQADGTWKAGTPLDTTAAAPPTSSESKVDLAEKDFPRFEDIVKANDLDEDWYEP